MAMPAGTMSTVDLDAAVELREELLHRQATFHATHTEQARQDVIKTVQQLHAALGEPCALPHSILGCMRKLLCAVCKQQSRCVLLRDRSLPCLSKGRGAEWQPASRPRVHFEHHAQDECSARLLTPPPPPFRMAGRKVSGEVAEQAADRMMQMGEPVHVPAEHPVFTPATGVGGWCSAGASMHASSVCGSNAPGSRAHPQPYPLLLTTLQAGESSRSCCSRWTRHWSLRTACASPWTSTRR